MNITLHLTLLAVAACLCTAEGAPDARVTRTKQQRPTRGFKNVEMMTARGFGKRDRPSARTERYGLDNFWESLELTPEREGLESDEKTSADGIPLDWFVNEMLNNPDFARSVVRKFIDLNQVVNELTGHLVSGSNRDPWTSVMPSLGGEEREGGKGEGGVAGCGPPAEGLAPSILELYDSLYEYNE